MITPVEIAWIAGILEGEGYFCIRQTPIISLRMTDLDIIEKFRALTKTTTTKIGVRPPKNEKHKIQYVTNMCGNLAIQWMMTIYPLMGIRRREKIRDIIEKWRGGEYVKEQARIQKEKYDGAASNKRWRESHREEILIANKKRYDENREKILAAKRKGYDENREDKRKHNAIKSLAISRKISLEEAEKMLDALMSGTIQ